MNESGGTRGVLKGNLKRRLVSASLAFTNVAVETSGLVTLRSVITGLCDVLNVFVGIGAFQVDDDGNEVALPAALWPAGGGTMQIIPQTNFPDRGKVLLRPVFQNPASLTPHDNDPLPQALPFSWNFPGECDEAVIETILDTGVWEGTDATLGKVAIVLQVMVEYNGYWWDAEAINLALGQVQLAPATAIQISG